MKLIKEYVIDGKEPTDEEFKECIEIVNSENCKVRLIFGYMDSGVPRSIVIPSGITYKQLKDGYENNKYALLGGIS